MQDRKPTLLGISMGMLCLFVLPVMAFAQTNAPSHQGQIWGSVQTEGRSTNDIYNRDVTIVVRQYREHRAGRIVATSLVDHGHYSVNMQSLPAAFYVIQVDPGDSDYQSGVRIIQYPAQNASVRQNWTLSMLQSAVPSKE